MKSKLTESERGAEAAFADKVYKNRGALSKQIQAVFKERNAQRAAGLPITAGVRPAAQQAKAKGLKYQTYIKMLLHEALATG